ncbi:MAG: helix-turn-helix domain-containing protein [Bacteroidia bacterium]
MNSINSTMTLPSQPLSGLIDGLTVLQYLASSTIERGSLEISRELGMEKTRVNRILKTLAFLGMAHQTANRRYIPGPGIHILSAQMLFGSGLINHSLKHLVKLTELNLVVAMGVLWRDKVSYLYHWEPDITPLDGLGRIELFPATQSSIGLALLSQKSEEEIQAIFPEEDLPGYSSRKKLTDDLRRFRNQNYVSTMYDGRKSIAVRLGTPSYAAIALARIDRDAPDLHYVQYLRETVAQIEAISTRFGQVF